MAPRPAGKPQAPPPPDFRLAIPSEEFKLPNGLRVVLSRDNAVPVVSLCLVYNTGSRVEEKGQAGYAYLLEHLMAQGPPGMDPGAYGKYVQANGGRIDAAAHPGYSIYSLTIPSNQLAPVLWFEAARMHSLAITPDTLKTQREAIAAERQRLFGEQGYNSAVLEGWHGLIYRNLHNSHPLTGSPDDLNAATPEEVTAFFRNWYAPGNAVLSLAGDFQTADTRALIEKDFGGIPSRPPAPRPDVSEPAVTDGRVAVSRDPHVGNPAVMIGWPAPARHSADWYAIQVLDAILTDGQTARLRLDLVEGRRSLLEVRSGIGFPFESAAGAADPSAYAIYALFRPGIRPESVVDQLQQEIDGVAAIGVDDTEMRRVRSAMRLSKVTGLQSSLERASLLARYALIDGDLSMIDKDFVALMNVTAADVQSVAKKVLTARRRDVLFILPAPPAAVPAEKK